MWAGVIGTLLGIVVGGGINFILNQAQFRREKEWQQKQLIREKLEEICQVIEEIDNAYRKLWVETIVYIHTLKEMQIGTINLPYPRLSMLINFYTPELKDFLALLEELGDIFGDTLGKANSAVVSGETSREEIISDLTNKYKLIQKVCGAMTTASADLARKYI